MCGARRSDLRSLAVALLCSALVGAVLAGSSIAPVLRDAARSESPAVQSPSLASEVLGGPAITPAKRAKAEGEVVGIPARVVPPLGTLAGLVVVWLAVGCADRRPPRETRRRAIGSRAPPSLLVAA